MKRKLLSVLLTLVLVLSFSLVTAAPVSAQTTINVPDDYSTIQAAITEASAGDTIIVAAGTYDEDQDLVISVALTLKGAQFGVDPTGTGRTGGESEIIRITIEADGVTIDGFTVSSPGTPSVNDGSEQSATIFVDGHDNCVIQNNIISGNHIGINLYGQYPPVTGEYSDDNLVTKNLLTASDTDSKYGIKVKGEYNTITDNELLDWTIAAIHITSDRDEGCSPDYNVISGNFIDGGDLLTSEIGIYIMTGSYLTISDNYITGVEGEGICLQDDWTSTGLNPPTGVTVSGNTITDLTGEALTPNNWANFNEQNYGSIGIVSREDVTGNTFTGNTISGVHYGFVFQKYDNIVNYNNIEGGLVNEDNTDTLDATNNWWGDATGADHADNPHGANAAGDVVSDNVEFTPWYATATTTPDTEYVTVNHEFSSVIALSDTIQGGIDAALAGDTITVAAGTYVESPTATVPLNLVGVAGEGGALPTLEGTLTINSISYTESDNMLIDKMNFLVPEGITGTDDSIVLQTVDGVTISNCSFDGNQSFIVTPPEAEIPLGPRAVQMYPLSSNVTIDNCTFKDGYYTAISGYVSNLSVTDSSIENCKSGINLQGGDNLVVENTDISVIAQGEPDTYCVRFASSGAGSGTDMNITGGIFTVDKDDQTPEEGNYHSAIIVRAGAAGILKVEGVSIGGEVVNLSTTELDAINNWWGHASGPADAAKFTESGYEAYGDAVSTNVDYEPWLLEIDGPTYEKTLALKDGWTLISVDKAVASPTWVGETLAYEYTAGFGDAALTDLEPLTAIYVKTEDGGGVGFNYAEVGEPPLPYSTELEAGWNLISIPDMALFDLYDILSPLRYVIIGTQQGVGLTTLVSQGEYNQFSGSSYDATLTDTDWEEGLPTLESFDGYWANMEGADTFEVIP